jgi:fructose-bisphosphate aldolase class II
MTPLKDQAPVGVIVGDDVQNVFAFAKAHGFALPGANCTGMTHVPGCGPVKKPSRRGCGLL